MEQGNVNLLLTAPAAGEPMQEHERLDLVPGVGIPDDRYATGAGHWCDPQWPDQEVTLVEAELATELGLEPARLRRNIVTTGVNLGKLIDREFTLGTAVLRGVRRCDPCLYLENLIQPGLLQELAGRGGLRATVIRQGTVTVGDTVEFGRTSSIQPND